MNGALGTIVEILHNSVFVLKTDQGVLLLVHPVRRISKDGDNVGKTFMLCSYGYATTMRKAQGFFDEFKM